MKYLMLLPLLLAFSPLASAQSKKVYRDAATHKSLVGRVKTQKEPLEDYKSSEKLDESQVSERYKPKSLIARSEILHARGFATLVPKRAVLHLPDGLKAYFGLPTGSTQVVPWSKFYVANRAWIDTVEVTRAQAEGRAPLSEELIKSFEKRRNVVVAVLQGGPISVLPVQAPAEEDKEANSKKPENKQVK